MAVNKGLPQKVYFFSGPSLNLVDSDSTVEVPCKLKVLLLNARSVSNKICQLTDLACTTETWLEGAGGDCSVHLVS